MDLSFFPKPRVVLSFASFSPSKFHLQQEFLGRGNQLSSSGFRFRRRCSRSGTQIVSPRCAAFQDFPFDSSILAVEATITTFTSFCAIYINYSRFRCGDPHLSDEELSFLTSSIDSTQDAEIVEHETVRSQFSSTEHLYAEPFLYRRMNIVEGTNDYVCSEEVIASDIKDAHPLKFQGSNLKHDDNKFNPGNELPDIETDRALPKVHGGEVLSPSIMVHELNIFVTGVLDEAVTASNISSLVIPVEKQVEICQNNEARHVTAQYGEVPVSDNDSILTQFGGVSFQKEEKQPYVRSISCFKILNSRTMHHIVWDMTGFNTRLRPSLKVAAVPPQKSHLTAEYMKQQELVACFKEGPGSKGKETVKDHDFTKIGRSFAHQTDNRNISRFRRPNGEVVKEANGPPAYLRTYNRLLREVRLEDCVDFLESMESKGLLDMDKVHHTRFLKVCKSQKSVEVAFRFSKLIKKPTLSTFNMLLSVCASSQDFDGAFQVMLLTKEAGLKPDCKLYTTLISSCAKCGKVDTMFEVFHEMVNAGVEPNANTYGALIDGCARSGQVAKAFGAYGIMRSKNVQPDRVIFNALITACGQSGAVDRAFDVLAEMMTEPKPIDPDHVTVGALMKTCTQAGQVERVREVYKMLHLYQIRGTPDVYTIAVRSCSHTGDWAFALSIYDDMKSNGLLPDEMFLSTLVDVAGHAGKVDAAFDILEDVRTTGIQLGSVSYSSLMGACCNANKWEKALELYEDIKTSKLIPTVPMLNALLTSLCDGDQLLKSVEVLEEMRKTRVRPNEITYSILIVACEKKGEAELALNLLLKAKADDILPNLVMCRCLTGLCLQSFEKAYLLGEPVVSFYSGRPQIDSKWTSSAIMVYHQTIAAGVIPSVEVFSQVLGCLKFPRDSSLRDRFVENLGMNFDSSRYSSVCSLLDGFGEYDTRCFSILEEAVSVGVIPRVSIKDNPIFVDARKFHIHIIEVYMLTILKGLKHRLAAGARLPNITVLLPIEKSVIQSGKGERIINLVGRIGQAVVSLMRRLGLPYQGNESLGRIRLNGLTLRRWFEPKLACSSIVLTPTLLAKGISDQQRTIRSGSNLSMEQ